MDTRFSTTQHPVNVPGLVREANRGSPVLLGEAVRQPEQGAATGAAPQSVRAETLDKAVARANEVLTQQGRSLQFSVDKQSGRTIVKVMDSATGQLIRQIPSEDWLRVVHTLESKPGNLLRAKA